MTRYKIQFNEVGSDWFIVGEFVSPPPDEASDPDPDGYRNALIGLVDAVNEYCRGGPRQFPQVEDRAELFVQEYVRIPRN